MTRSILTIAAALFAATTFLAPSAKACISCEYVPPVVNTPVYSHGGAHYGHGRVRATVDVRRARAAKRRLLAAEAKAQARAQARAEARAEAKAEAKREAIASAKAAPVELDVKNENSTISTASVDASEAGDAKKTTGKDTEVSENVGCKKFFPSVGMTLTVPCE